ncbi:hypothetical protein D9M68_711790 [compost metagenome]
MSTISASGLRSCSKRALMASNALCSGSMSALRCTSEPSRSAVVSMRCAISPRRKAPARRALPLRVCRLRSTSARALALSGRETHWRSAPSSWGISSCASSAKIGNRSTSMVSSTSMSSSMSCTGPWLSASTWGAITLAGSPKPVTSNAGGAKADGTSSGATVLSMVGAASCGSSASQREGSSVSIPSVLGTGACNSRSSAASRSALGSLKKPAANWCSRRRMSSAASTNSCDCSAVATTPPCWCRATAPKACSSARAMSDNG